MTKCLRDYDENEIKDIIESVGEKKFRAKQLYQWINKAVVSYDEMGNIPKGLKDKLAANYVVNNMTIAERLESKIDGTRKYLMELNDGNIIECVLMRYKHGNSICISTQVGCRMGCSFCASTIGGVERNLTSGEMLGQILAVSRDIDDRISNIVLMGSGEPLDNYKEVVKFLRMVNAEAGLNIGMRNITLSTCGLVKEIEMLMNENIQITLAVSLHAVDNDKRDALIPVNKKYPIQMLMKACQDYIDKTGRRITFEFSLINGVNDDLETAKRLGKMLKGMLCHVNLIPVNPVKERDFKGTDQKQAERFRDAVKKFGIEATIRRELGRDINAACGQLRRDYVKSNS